MLNHFKFFNQLPLRLPYLGGAPAPRPYRDWYVLVGVSFLLLVGLLGVYAWAVANITDYQAWSDQTVIDRSVQKIKPEELAKIISQVQTKQQNSSDLAAKPIFMADPSR